MKISHSFFLAALVITMGCENDGITRQPPSDVRVFHAASNLSPVSFEREAMQIGIVAYNEGLITSFESGQYDFNVRHQPAGSNQLANLFSFSETLSPNLDYTFILVTTNGQPGVFIVTTDDQPPSDTTARIAIAHAYEGRGDLDVYIEPEGTLLTTVTPRTTISFGINPSTFEVDPGVTSIFLTSAGNPNDIVFESTPQGPVAGADVVFVVSDPGEMGTLDIQVSAVGTNTGRIGQVGEDARLRVIQGIDDRLARDIYFNDTLIPPLFPALPFGVIPPYEDTEISLGQVITTPVGAPGTEDDSFSYFVNPGELSTALIAGNTVDGLVSVIIPEDKRSIDGQATLRILNAAGLFIPIEVYLEVPGTDITTQTPFLIMNLASATDRIRLVPDDYEITIVDNTTQAVLAGPLIVTTDDGGVYGVLLLNSAGGSTVDIQLFDDFIP